MAVKAGAQDPRDFKAGAQQVKTLRVNGHSIWRHQSVPHITGFGSNRYWDASGATAPNLHLTFSVTGSTQNRIHRANGDNVPLSGTNETIIPAPTADEVFTLTSSNAAGQVTAVVRYYRWIQPTITMAAAYVSGLTTVSPGLTGHVNMHPWGTGAVITLSPENHGLSSAQIVRYLNRQSGDNRPFQTTGNPRLSSQPRISQRYTLTAQLRIDGENVGTAASASVDLNW